MSWLFKSKGESKMKLLLSKFVALGRLHVPNMISTTVAVSYVHQFNLSTAVLTLHHTDTT